MIADLVTIESKFEEFKQEAAKFCEKGNKAAGTRSRKTSLELAALLKEWRAKSVKA